MHGDAVVACADLAERTGANEFKIGFAHKDVPVEDAGWYAQAIFRGARIMVQDHRSPSTAALALAERLLAGVRCQCGRTVTLDDTSGCRWRLMGQRWEPGCNVKPFSLPAANRGDVGAMQRAVENRAARRRRRKRGA
jgi:hypothetical protein